MNRREAVSSVAALLGGTLVGAELFVSCAPGTRNVNTLFNPDQVSLLAEIADTILPPTKTPGAREAGVGEFMALVVQDCYRSQDQKIFLEGMSAINEASNKQYGHDFMALDAAQRTALLTDLDKEQRMYMKQKERTAPSHYFRMMKELTLLGYFTSELGATQALRYVAVPGRYDGNYPYKKGDRAWA